MKKYIVEKNMSNSTDGYFDVVVEGENHINRTKIRSKIQFFTMEGGYNFNHPLRVAKQNAEAIALGLNMLELKKWVEQKKVWKNDS